jgi:predicted NUDIX family NTP pyrophosphohydrolase
MPMSSKAVLTTRLREADVQVVNIHPADSFFLL